MPSGGVHIIVAKEVSSKLLFEPDNNYYVGSVAADSWRNSSSTKKTSHFILDDNLLSYRYDYFLDKYKNNIKDPFVLGYLIHLITDYYWYNNEFYSSKFGCNSDDVCSVVNKILPTYNIGLLDYSFTNPINEIETSGIYKTIDYLNKINNFKPLNDSIDIDDFNTCIDETVNFVTYELKRLNVDVNKSKNIDNIKYL